MRNKAERCLLILRLWGLRNRGDFKSLAKQQKNVRKKSENVQLSRVCLVAEQKTQHGLANSARELTQQTAFHGVHTDA